MCTHPPAQGMQLPLSKPLLCQLYANCDMLLRMPIYSISMEVEMVRPKNGTNADGLQGGADTEGLMYRNGL